MSPRPRDRAWPMAASLIWVAASIGVVASATNGSIFRPGVSLTPADVARSLVVTIAVGWPLLTASVGTLALVAGHGTIVLAIAGVAGERPLGEVWFPISGWLAAVAVAYGIRTFADRRQCRREVVWSTLCGLAIVGAIWFSG